MKIIKDDLSNQDLIVDRVYGGSRKGNYSDEFLSKLLGVDNGAGFRCLGSPRTDPSTLRILVLQTSFSELDWPDSIDISTGLFTYYGDNREAGDLHETKRDGNKILRNLFDYAHNTDISTRFPLIFLFGKTGTYRDAKFLGLAVPGAKDMSSDEDLTAVWRVTADGVRFQNYKSTFTILDIPVVDRRWIKDAQNGNALSSPFASKTWLDWIQKRIYKPLEVEQPSGARTRKEQTDLTKEQHQVIELLHRSFKDRPTDFERVAAKIVEYALPNAHSIELTRPWRDGGRDALGKYRVFQGLGGIDVKFAMEAKCFSLNNSVGVREASRLISRIKHRQFGVIVTTSFVGKQAYCEIIQDEHPVVVICAVDIAKILKKKFVHLGDIEKWLEEVEDESLYF